MAENNVELRYAQPASPTEARRLRDDLTQRMREIEASLSPLNQERPSQKDITSYKIWAEKRERRINALNKVKSHLQFVQNWLDTYESRHFIAINERPSRLLNKIINRIKPLEELWEAVGDLLRDGSDEAFDAVKRKYRLASIALGEDEETSS